MTFSHTHKVEVNAEVSVYLLSYNSFEPEAYVNKLNPIEQKRLLQFGHPAKKMEFIATRLLKESLFPNSAIQHSEIGAPFLEADYPTPYISISHTTNMVGIATSSFPIGMDLEPISHKAKKIMHKFLNEKELLQLNCEDEKEITRAWSAKEALYKLAGRKEILFQEDLLLEKLSADTWQGTICNPDGHLTCPLRFFQSEHTILTINEKPCIRVE